MRALRQDVSCAARKIRRRIHPIRRRKFYRPRFLCCSSHRRKHPPEKFLGRHLHVLGRKNHCRRRCYFWRGIRQRFKTFTPLSRDLRESGSPSRFQVFAKRNREFLPGCSSLFKGRQKSSFFGNTMPSGRLKSFSKKGFRKSIHRRCGLSRSSLPCPIRKIRSGTFSRGARPPRENSFQTEG